MLPDQAAALEEAIGLAQRGALAQAERLLQSLLAQDPTVARAYNVLGIVQLQQGKLDDAEASLVRAGRLTPDDPRIHINLGKLYSTQRRAADAERHLREALRLDPVNATAHFNLAVFLREHGRVAEAEAGFRRTVELDPLDAEAWSSLGALLHAARRLSEAEECLRSAIQARPDYAEAHYRLARLMLETFRFAQAEACFREAIRLRPEFAPARSDLAMVLLETGRLHEAQESCREATRINPGFLRAWSNYVMCGQYDPGASDDELLARALQAGGAAQAAAGRFSAPLAPAARLPAKLSLGFVSGDLHHHPVGLFLLPLLRQFARQGVKLALYSDSTIVDEVSDEFRALATWIDIAAQSDDEVWSRIRRDRPDALIDLAGHTGTNRLAVFAGRAAPLQISWLGYFATTGTPNMDCVLMDPWHAPAGVERQFSERILRMPHTRFCFQPLASAPAVAPRAPAAESGRITFGSFNSVAKINDRVIDAWSRILRGTPASRLVLKWRTLADASYRDELASRFLRAGVGAERLELRPASNHAALLAQYRDIDIALDPFPFTGGQSSFEAFWMGVPVVTLAGHRPVSRQTLCILGNLGLEDLAARDVEGYAARAIALANDLARLEDLRSSLRQRMQGSPLMQAPEFAQAFMDALRNGAGTV